MFLLVAEVLLGDATRRASDLAAHENGSRHRGNTHSGADGEAIPELPTRSTVFKGHGFQTRILESVVVDHLDLCGNGDGCEFLASREGAGTDRVDSGAERHAFKVRTVLEHVGGDSGDRLVQSAEIEALHLAAVEEVGPELGHRCRDFECRKCRAVECVVSELRDCIAEMDSRKKRAAAERSLGDDGEAVGQGRFREGGALIEYIGADRSVFGNGDRSDRRAGERVVAVRRDLIEVDGRKRGPAAEGVVAEGHKAVGQRHFGDLREGRVVLLVEGVLLDADDRLCLVRCGNFDLGDRRIEEGVAAHDVSLVARSLEGERVVRRLDIAAGVAGVVIAVVVETVVLLKSFVLAGGFMIVLGRGLRPLALEEVAHIAAGVAGLVHRLVVVGVHMVGDGRDGEFVGVEDPAHRVDARFLPRGKGDVVYGALCLRARIEVIQPVEAVVDAVGIQLIGSPRLPSFTLGEPHGDGIGLGRNVEGEVRVVGRRIRLGRLTDDDGIEECLGRLRGRCGEIDVDHVRELGTAARAGARCVEGVERLTILGIDRVVVGTNLPALIADDVLLPFGVGVNVVAPAGSNAADAVLCAAFAVGVIFLAPLLLRAANGADLPVLGRALNTVRVCRVFMLMLGNGDVARARLPAHDVDARRLDFEVGAQTRRVVARILVAELGVPDLEGIRRRKFRLYGEGLAVLLQFEVIAILFDVVDHGGGGIFARPLAARLGRDLTDEVHIILRLNAERVDLLFEREGDLVLFERAVLLGADGELIHAVGARLNDDVAAHVLEHALRRRCVEVVGGEHEVVVPNGGGVAVVIRALRDGVLLDELKFIVGIDL